MYLLSDSQEIQYGRSFSRCCLGLLLAVLVAGCAVKRTSVDYDSAINFASLKTYQWVNSPKKIYNDPRLDNDLLQGRIEQAIHQTLQSKGFSQPEQPPADFEVTYHLAIEKRVETEQIRTGFGVHQGWWGWGVSNDVMVDQYDEGTLMIDILSSVSKKLIWRGTIKYRVRERVSVAQQQTLVNQRVAEVLANFPPTSAQ